MSRTSIISELSEISPLLAGLPATTPYHTPPAYFEQLPSTLLGLVQDNAVLPSLTADQKQPYTLPEHYFDSLAATVLSRVQGNALSAQEETASLSPLLAGLDKTIRFDLPPDYFSRIEWPALLHQEIDTTDHDVPAFLHDARGASSFQVPAGYFETLPSAILQKVSTPVPATVITMNTRSRWMRYAVAASVAAVVAVSGWFYFRVHTDPNANKSELAYIKNLSSSELQDFVDKNPMLLPETNASASVSDAVEADDLKIMLAGVSDEELQQYLEQQPPADPGTDTFN